MASETAAAEKESAGRRTWSVEALARFWQRPDPQVVPDALSEDVVGYWSGRKAPVKCREDHTACIEALVKALPDVRVEVAETASAGDCTFIHWLMYATGQKGSFEIAGVDRIRLRDGMVRENRVFVDPLLFEEKAGMKIPWSDH
jgi:ketosteroid isomerase-like protein